ncbi:phosphoglycerate kinase [Candidatus Pacearchaeota archaeon]|nr:phosphoglycerate kinase [Candidatus Pacearchaeota archaeon]
MNFKTIDNFNFWGKRVLVRADLNSPVSSKGKVLMNDRIEESARTLKELKMEGARVVVLAHQSRPGEKDFISLKQHAKLLSKFVKVKFIKDMIWKNAVEEIKKLKMGEVLLLENIRFEKDEFKPSVNNKIVKTLAPLFDYYVNDAFSVCHRNETSIVSFPEVLPSCAGRLMENELNHLDKIKVGNCLFVLGGAKMDEIISLIDGKRKVLAGGLLGPLILFANGQKFGKMDKLLMGQKKYFRKLKNPKNVVPAVDYAFDISGKRKEMMLDELPCKYDVLDIGKKSIEIFVKEIKKVKCIFVKGPQGKYEDAQFSKGTREVLKAVVRSKAFSVLGGGHTENALKELGFSRKDFSYVSLSGGATVKYIFGKKLVGMEVMNRGSCIFKHV